MKLSHRFNYPESPILTGWRQIAAFLNVHPETAMKLSREGGLPPNNENGRVSYDLKKRGPLVGP